MKKLWKKTEGYKTKSGALLYLLFQLFKSIFPDALNESTEEVVRYSIDLIILTGSADWIWRNKNRILSWFINLKEKLWKKEKDF